MNVRLKAFNDSTGAAEKKISIDFSKANIKFCLSLHYNGDGDKFKEKDNIIGKIFV